MRDDSFYVYMTTNRWNTVLYTGVTNNLERRIWEHASAENRGFTHKYNANRLVYFEEYDQIRLAIAREKQIKGWSRRKKNALVATTNPGWVDLWDEAGRPRYPMT
ncbi:MAG: GIY-YIG nuclease family protein [Thermoanaerobaculia bacterium]